MAQLPIVFPSLGFLGLNKEKAFTPLAPEWATQADNAVIDSAGRYAARQGYVNQTATPATGSPAFLSLHEYIVGDGTTRLIAGSAAKLWDSSDNGSTWTDRTGALTPSGGQWQLFDFNKKTMGVQIGHSMIVKTGAGNFANVTASSGSVPTSPVAAHGAFGRVWAISSDYQTLNWSALLDETKWATADGAGLVNMTSVWTQGMDQALAVASFNGRIVVFGKRHIVIWTDGQGSALGLDPTKMYVEQVIEGAGISARDSIQPVGEGELLFLSQNGIRSLVQVKQEDGSPFVSVTDNLRSYVATTYLGSNIDQTKVRSLYSPEQGFYLLVSPDVNASLYVNLRVRLPDGSRPVFEWPGVIPGSVCRRVNGDILYGFSGTVGKYGGYLDGASTYTFTFFSGFLDLSAYSKEDPINQYFKELKEIRAQVYCPGGYTVTLLWKWDWNPTQYSDTLTFTGDTTAEYGTAQYGIAEYGGSLAQRDGQRPGWASGQFLAIGITTTINAQPFAFQSLTAYLELGNIA